MPEQHPLGRRDEVVTIGKFVRGRRTPIIDVSARAARKAL